MHLTEALQTIQTLERKNTSLEEDVKKLHHLINELKRAVYGPKSEKFESIDENQAHLFNEIEQEELKLDSKTQTVTYQRKKGRQKKNPFPEHLPREEEIIDIPEDKKICPHDGAQLKCIGEDVTEKVKTIPAQMSIVLVKKLKYACPCCEKNILTAPCNSILPGTIATAETISFLIYSKFFQSLPLYRLQEQYKLNGIDITRATMARWLTQVSEKLIPIWNILEEKAILSEYMAIDATTVQVLKEKGRKAQTKSFMWARGSPEQGIALFDYDVSGAGEIAKKLMSGFNGALQGDAHKGYNKLDKKNILLLGCLMHSRRRFYKAWLEAKKQPGIAQDALSMFKFLYDKEEQYKNKGLTPAQRKEWREKEIAPSLEEIKKWCGWKIKEVPPSSTIANALNYFINEYDELTAFLKNGRYEMDNGWIEQVIKRFAIGRKNWMFSDSVEGAHASSILYSLTLTAKLNGKDPYQVMVNVLRKLPNAKSIEDLEEIAELFLSGYNLKSCLKKEGALIH